MYRKTHLSQSSKERIKGMLFHLHVLVCGMYMFQYNNTCFHQGPRDNSENIVTCIYNMYYVDSY